jgi:hypothetical protein
MKLNNLTWPALLAVGATLAACGKAQMGTEATSAASARPTLLMSAPAASDGNLGVALYPGMVTLVGARGTPVAKRGTLIDATFKSADTPERIAAFYREQLSKRFGDETQFLEEPQAEGLIRIQASNGQSQSIEMSIRPEGADSIVTIQSLVKAK